MHDGREAADEFGAHLSQWGHGCGQEGLHTHVTRHLITPVLGQRVAPTEPWELLVLGDQDQLEGGVERKRERERERERERQSVCILFTDLLLILGAASVCQKAGKSH